jgi:hypothetical protein
MGLQLKLFYEQAKAKGGPAAMVKLAAKTKIPSLIAESQPDTPENISKFRAAMVELGL